MIFELDQELVHHILKEWLSWQDLSSCDMACCGSSRSNWLAVLKGLIRPHGLLTSNGMNSTKQLPLGNFLRWLHTRGMSVSEWVLSVSNVESQMTLDDMREVSTLCVTIHRLVIEFGFFCYTLTDLVREIISHVVSHSRCLEEVIISDCVEIGLDILNIINHHMMSSSSSSLKKVELNRVQQLSTPMVAQFLLHHANTLEELTVLRCYDCDLTEILTFLNQHAIRLRTLTLVVESPSSLTEDELLTYLSSQGGVLEYLLIRRLSKRFSFSENLLRAIGEACPSLISLTLTSHSDDDQVEEDQEEQEDEDDNDDQEDDDEEEEDDDDDQGDGSNEEDERDSSGGEGKEEVVVQPSSSSSSPLWQYFPNLVTLDLNEISVSINRQKKRVRVVIGHEAWVGSLDQWILSFLQNLDNDFSIEVTANVVDTSALLSMIRKWSLHLVKLDAYFYELQDDVVEEMMGTCLRLTVLKLVATVDCRLTDSMLHTIALHGTALQVLEVVIDEENDSKFSDEGVCDVLTSCRSLTKVEIHGAGCRSFKAVRNLPLLESFIFYNVVATAEQVVDMLFDDELTWPIHLTTARAILCDGSGFELSTSLSSLSGSDICKRWRSDGSPIFLSLFAAPRSCFDD